METIRNRIWAELTQSKHSIHFISLYSDRQRLVLRIFNIGILIFSSAGVMGWKIWSGIPLIACVIISAVSLIRLVQPHLIMDDKQLKNLDVIHRFYADYYNKIEQLWFNFDSDKMDENQALEEFFKLKELETDINPVIAETIRSKPKRIIKKCKKYTDEYFQQIFNI